MRGCIILNRTERRRMKRQEEDKEKTLMLKPKHINERLQQDVHKNTLKNLALVIDLVRLSTLQSLHEEHGFGKKRLKQVNDKMLEVVDDVIKGYISIEDMKKWYKDCVGEEI